MPIAEDDPEMREEVRANPHPHPQPIAEGDPPEEMRARVRPAEGKARS